MRRLVVPLLLLSLGCAAKHPVKAPVPSFSMIVPRYCLLGDGPSWTPDSYCRMSTGKWMCYKMTIRTKKDCEHLDVQPDR